MRRLKKAKTRNVNKEVGEILGRLEHGIQKMRTKAEYKKVERNLREEEEITEGENAVTDKVENIERKPAETMEIRQEQVNQQTIFKQDTYEYCPCLFQNSDKHCRT